MKINNMNEQQPITLIESNNYINDGGLHVVEDYVREVTATLWQSL